MPSREEQWFYGLQRFGTKLGLENIVRLLEKLGNPHKDLKFIYITGTNGKGSVTAMIDSILRQAGYNAGMFTSPHLVKYNERIRINGKMISDEDIKELIKIIRPHAEEFGCTFFEATTALAMLYFKDKVDYVALEVGMGGELDATNVVNPLVSVITKVSLDHQNHLGKTIEKITLTKSGIIKENKPVVTGAKGKALEIIKKVSSERGSKLFVVKNRKKTILPGDFQEDNAAIAAETIKVLNKFYNLGISNECLNAGLMGVKWPGRLDFRNGLLMDGAHNPDGISALTKELKKRKTKNIVIVFGAMKDKNYAEMLEMLEPFASDIILTKTKLDRAAFPEKMAEYTKKAVITENAEEAINYAKRTSNNLILVTGSIYLVGEIMEILKYEIE